MNRESAGSIPRDPGEVNLLTFDVYSLKVGILLVYQLVSFYIYSS